MERYGQEYFRRRLMEERERLLAAQKGNFGLGKAVRDSISELSAYDNHPADLGSETFERGKDLALLDNNRLLLSKVEAALDRIKGGNYGICASCGKPISRARLEAVPYAAHCRKCQAEEDAGDRAVRPSEEAVLFPPFGRTFLDGADSVGFDGEDAWQAAARHGTAESPQDVPGAVSFKDLADYGEEEDDDIDQISIDAWVPGTTDGPKRLSLWTLGAERQSKVKAKLRRRRRPGG